MTGHLSTEQLVDLAEGVIAEQTLPHLGTCDTCRRALTELRGTLADAAAADDVHEPSPLFWDHLSARVRESIAGEEVPGRGGWFERWRRLPQVRFALPGLAALGVVALALAVVVSRHSVAPQLIPARPLPIGDNARLPSLAPLEPLGAAGDPSLDLMADYGDTLTWDDMREEMALSTHAGVADEAVSTLSAEERQELQRLLEEEMSQPSALGAS